MGTFHQNVIITDNGLSPCVGGSVDNHILTKDIIVTNDTFSLFTSELEILWQRGNDSTLMYLIIITHARTITYTDEGENNTIVTNHHITLYVYEGEYFTIIADFRSGVDFGLRTYFTCHNYQL
jgi:hypothetical protein